MADYVNNKLKALPFEQIIGAPLTAAINAQTLAAKATVEFIKEVGFLPAKTPGGGQQTDTVQNFGEVRNVVFKYVATSDDGTESVAELSAPILTIVPVPYLRIDDMTIDFTANITESFDDTSSLNKKTDTGGGADVYVPFWAPAKVNFGAKVSTTSSSSSSSRYKTEYKMGIHLNAVQDDMPAGLSKVLNILENAIKDKPAVSAGAGTTASLTITVKDGDAAISKEAFLTLIGYSLEAQSTSDGSYDFGAIPYGVYTIQAVYNAQTINKTINVNSETPTEEIVFNPVVSS